MAKQIVAWCDVHMEKDEQVPASSIRMSLDGGPTLEVDLCDPCQKELVEPLRLLLEGAGQPVTPVKQTRAKRGSALSGNGPFTCPECGEESKNRDTFGKHLRRMHDMSLRDLRGEAPPKGETPVVETAKPYGCPDCDSMFETPQGVGAHRHRTHGYVSPTAGQRQKKRDKQDTLV